MRRKCDKCNGTGREPCDIHGSHVCDKCNGRGCVEIKDWPKKENYWSIR